MENNEQQIIDANGQNVTAEKKPKGRFIDSWFMLYIITFLLILVGQIAGSAATIACQIGGAVLPKFAPVLNAFGLYIAFTGIWVVFLAYFFIFKRNRPLKSVVTKKLRGNNIKGLLIGLVIGGAQNTLCILSAYKHGDIELHFNEFNIIYLLLIFFAVFVQSSAEELSCRGFMFYKLNQRYNKPALAVFISAMFFGILHLGNEGITILSFISIVATGVFYAMIVHYTDSLWCVFSAHAAWNFTQNIVFGLPNSGIPSSYSIITLNIDTAKDSFFYNTVFGVEGTYFADIVLIVSCIVLFLLRKQLASKEKYDIWTDSIIVNEVKAVK